jgi:hypothetical protein
MHFKIRIIIVFLITLQFLALGGLRPVPYISGELSPLKLRFPPMKIPMSIILILR